MEDLSIENEILKKKLKDILNLPRYNTSCHKNYDGSLKGSVKLDEAGFWISTTRILEIIGREYVWVK